MLADGPTWFLVADGRRARVMLEARRGATLAEVWAMTIGEQDLYDPQDRPPRSFDRVGAGRHAMDKGQNLHEAEEAAFLKRVALRVADAAKDKLYDHLVLAAPPRALGILRNELSDAARARLRAESSKDVVGETAEALRERLRELLQR